MTYLSLILPFVWIAHAIWAPTVSGRANRTNPMQITRANAEVMFDGTITAFAYVQERGEFRLYKGLTALIGTAVLLGCIAYGVPAVGLLIGGLVGMFALESLVRFISAIDIAGHGAEIMAAEAELLPEEAMAYHYREAVSVAGQYDLSTDEAIEMLDRWQWLARIVYRLGA